MVESVSMIEFSRKKTLEDDKRWLRSGPFHVDLKSHASQMFKINSNLTCISSRVKKRSVCVLRKHWRLRYAFKHFSNDHDLCVNYWTLFVCLFPLMNFRWDIWDKGDNWTTTENNETPNSQGSYDILLFFIHFSKQTGCVIKNDKL